MRPIRYARDMSMLQRIEMNVVDMALQIGVVANGVLPIATLPDALLSFGNFACGSRLRIKATRKAALDQAPARGKIGVAFRQGPEGVQVIGQDANRDRFKRSTLLDCPVNPPEAVDLLEQKVTRPFGKNNREKENAALDFGSTILRHNELYHEASWWARRKSAFAHPTKLRWL